MTLKKTAINLSFVLVVCALPGCGGAEHNDMYEQLERPPQIAVTPSTEEAPAIRNEREISNGLGDDITLLGKKNASLLKLNLDFDNAWLVVGKALRHRKLAITDHDRDQGHYLVNFDTNAYKQETGFFEGIGDSLFAENFGLRKYLLTVKQVGKSTIVTAKDLGAITTEADKEDDVEEVVDAKSKGPDDSELRILSVLYKDLHDGFVEPGMHHKKGFLDSD